VRPAIPSKSGVAISKQQGHLIRGIGFVGGAFLVLNGMLGAGIFALPSAVVERAGALSPWLFFGAGFLIITIVLSMAELSSYFRTSGGPALYATEAFGPLVGFSTGWLYYVSRVAAVSANSHVMAVYLGTVWAWLDTSTGHAVVILGVCVGLTVVNVLGVKDGVRTLSVFTFLKVIPLILLVLIGLRSVSPDILFPELVPTIDDLGGTTLLLIYAFVGFESVLVTAGETEKPRRTIPSALVRTVIFMAAFYFLIMIVYMSVLPPDVARSGTLVDVGRQLAGPAGAIAITLAAVFSIGGNMSGSVLSSPRLTLAMAEHGLLPAWFGRIHPRYSSPANSIMFLGGLAALLALTGSFVFLAVASSLTRLITFVICILALPVIRKRADSETLQQAYRLKGGYTIPVLALVVCVWMGAHSSLDSWIYVAGLLGIGLAFYWLERVLLRKS
jgi:amino acid transporter